MRIALLSDLHANAQALQACASDIRAADLVVALGDYVGYYCGVNEVIDFVRDLDALCLRGNHDHFLLHGCPADANDAVRFGIEYADRVIDPDHRKWLAGLPAIWGGELAGCLALFVHGSPWSPIHGYLYEDSLLLPQLKAFDYDLIAFGQTHRPYLDDGGRPLLVNPGSIGQSRHVASKACMALVDTAQRACQLIERPYDPTATIDRARRNGARDWILKHLVSPSSGGTGVQHGTA